MCVSPSPSMVLLIIIVCVGCDGDSHILNAQLYLLSQQCFGKAVSRTRRICASTLPFMVPWYDWRIGPQKCNVTVPTQWIKRFGITIGGNGKGSYQNCFTYLYHSYLYGLQYLPRFICVYHSFWIINWYKSDVVATGLEIPSDGCRCSLAQLLLFLWFGLYQKSDRAYLLSPVVDKRIQAPCRFLKLLRNLYVLGVQELFTVQVSSRA